MLLAVDIGNTNTVFAFFDGDRLLQSWRLKTDAARTRDEYKVALSCLLADSNLRAQDIKSIIVSSVVPDANYALRSFCQDMFGAKPLVVTRDHVDIEIDLRSPDEVGADRLVNALTVKVEYDLPAIVIDFGTATTFDVIDGQGRYAGGVIAPGINLSIEALHRAAAKLPMIGVKKPEDGIIGKDTTSAMQSGVFYGYMSLIEGVLDKIGAELGAKPAVLATGGLAPLFAEYCPAIDKVDETLTLRGLLRIYQGHDKS